MSPLIVLAAFGAGAWAYKTFGCAQSPYNVRRLFRPRKRATPPITRETLMTGPFGPQATYRLTGGVTDKTHEFPCRLKG
jgi:hypothetical protein